MKKKLPAIEYIVYALMNIAFLGGPWMVKIIIKKAIQEAQS